MQLAVDRPELVGSLVLSEPPQVDVLIDRADRKVVGGLGPDAEVSMIDGDNHMLRCGARRGYGVPRPVALRGG